MHEIYKKGVGGRNKCALRGSVYTLLGGHLEMQQTRLWGKLRHVDKRQGAIKQHSSPCFLREQLKQTFYNTKNSATVNRADSRFNQLRLFASIRICLLFSSLFSLQYLSIALSTFLCICSSIGLSAVCLSVCLPVCSLILRCLSLA